MSESQIEVSAEDEDMMPDDLVPDSFLHLVDTPRFEGLAHTRNQFFLPLVYSTERTMARLGPKRAQRRTAQIVLRRPKSTYREWERTHRILCDEYNIEGAC